MGSNRPAPAYFYVLPNGKSNMYFKTVPRPLEPRLQPPTGTLFPVLIRTALQILLIPGMRLPATADFISQYLFLLTKQNITFRMMIFLFQELIYTKRNLVHIYIIFGK